MTDRIKSAFERAGQPVKRGTMAHNHELYMMLVDTAVQMRDAAALREFITPLEELAVRDNHRLYLPIAYRAYGVAHLLDGEYAEGAERLQQALDAFTALGTRYQVARTLVEMGELEHLRGAPALAREYFARARDEFRALGATPDLQRTETTLADLHN